ncbi:CsbD family protein [Acetobacter sp. AN02]|uniref:CsbD family protein n=1 Tax=Acetobacter sp. AN02 TaxID=2894186 RepID=UPI0024345CAC|nr:CsbD family protein [Acetobacter sp. AN02]MDG6093971.1 CsbD family protein [Acetobacter sp. AN02]
MSEDKLNAAGEKLEAAAQKVTGHIKDAAGGLTGDAGLQAEGKVDQLAGMAREEFADLYQESEGFLERVITFVRDKPLPALGIAWLVGVISGRILLPRRRRK